MIGLLLFALLGVLLRRQTQNVRPSESQNKCHTPQSGIAAKRIETKSTFKYLYGNSSTQIKSKSKKIKKKSLLLL